jgi:hypothetical protein
MSADWNDSTTVTFLIVILSVGFSASLCDAGVIATFEEINGGADLRVSVSGFLDTAALGTPQTTTDQNGNLGWGGSDWAYISMGSASLVAIDRWTVIPVATTGAGSNFASLFMNGNGVLVSGPEFFFAANDDQNRIQVQDTYLSGTVVNSVVEYAGMNFSSQGITAGDELTKEWFGGGAGNFITFTTAVPEPPTFAFVALGSFAFGLVAYRRRRERSA